jgi:hypothetical protein
VELHQGKTGKRLDELEKRVQNLGIKENASNDDSNADTQQGGSILRRGKTPKSFNERSIATRDFIDLAIPSNCGYHAGDECQHISNLVNLSVGGKKFSLGVLSPNTTSQTLPT